MRAVYLPFWMCSARARVRFRARIGYTHETGTGKQRRRCGARVADPPAHGGGGRVPVRINGQSGALAGEPLELGALAWGAMLVLAAGVLALSWSVLQVLFR